MRGSRYLPLLTPPPPAARTTRVSAAGGRASSPPQRAGEEQRGAWRASHICHQPRVRPNIGPEAARAGGGTALLVELMLIFYVLVKFTGCPVKLSAPVFYL